MDNLALIEESTFLTLVNAYATLETLRQCNPNFMDKLFFDEERCQNIKEKFTGDYVNIPIDFSNETIEKLERKFGKEGD